MRSELLSTLDLENWLKAAWSRETSSKWSLENPAKGQCSVTALVVQDLLGGDILKTQTTDGLHFYNFIDGTRWDFTSSQFDHAIGYDDLSSSRAEALADTTVAQYEALRSRVTPR